ncbi:MAG: Biotin carboxylase [Candidatus Marinimicrobia bacterium]|nr:Biotin carboxylase [Candidatus Neomarinimicrobiota bacterium]
MFNKILIANRGEIALRIIRACHELGVSTVAVYSEIDELSLHVRFADEAICVGPPPGNMSYMNVPQIISAAEVTNADAIHPGYGFLAENSRFADVCEDHDITFIGPSAEVMSRMGDKSVAKETMMNADVPVIPGSEGKVETAEDAKKIASDIGLPVIIKAAAGGGGRGMRVVKEMEDLENYFAMARSESQAAFDSPDLYVEKFIEQPRHVEVQLLGDSFGEVVALGERECSIQRRHQKLIEESPSPAVDEELRAKMCNAAVRGAKEVGYESAGTIEFLLDAEKNFYFMEMNTRIQVEHPVTEMVVGIDLIKEQIRVAAGGKVAPWMKNFKLRGHSIECRVNAEDPEHGFRPSPGEITSFHMPGGMGMRVDTHAYAGYTIPPTYDSMIGKIISHGRDRREAIDRMQRALEETVIEGIKTTIPFQQQVLADERFISGNFDTKFLENFTFQPEGI